MKIYIVERTTCAFGSYEYYRSSEIVGVYSTFDNAKEAISKSEKHHPTWINEDDKNEYDFYKVHEMTLDDYSIAEESDFFIRWHLSNDDIFDTLTGSE